MAAIKNKTKANKRGKITGTGGETWVPVHCWRECERVQPLNKTVAWLFKKLKIKLPYFLTLNEIKQRIKVGKGHKNKRLYKKSENTFTLLMIA